MKASLTYIPKLIYLSIIGDLSEVCLYTKKVRLSLQVNPGCGSGCKIINIANPGPPFPARGLVPPPTFYKVHSCLASGPDSGQCEDKKSINIKLLPTFIIFFSSFFPPKQSSPPSLLDTGKKHLSHLIINKEKRGLKYPAVQFYYLILLWTK